MLLVRLTRGQGPATKEGDSERTIILDNRVKSICQCVSSELSVSHIFLLADFHPKARWNNIMTGLGEIVIPMGVGKRGKEPCAMEQLHAKRDLDPISLSKIIPQIMFWRCKSINKIVAILMSKINICSISRVLLVQIRGCKRLPKMLNFYI